MAADAEDLCECVNIQDLGGSYIKRHRICKRRLDHHHSDTGGILKARRELRQSVEDGQISSNGFECESMSLEISNAITNLLAAPEDAS